MKYKYRLPGVLALAALAILIYAGEAFCAAIRFSPAKPRQGDVVAVWVEKVDDVEPGARLSAFGRDFPLMANGKGYFGLIAVDHDVKPGSHPVEATGSGGRVVSAKLTVAKRSFEEQHLKVDKKTVDLSKEDEERAERERVRINEALSARTPAKLWTGGFARPAGGEVSSTFGLKRYYNGKAKGYHGGLDIAAPRGAPVRAAGSGRVVLAGDFFFTGNTVFVDHGYGLLTAYFHMDELAVKDGERLEEGRIVGRVGSTGRSTGPHLHWSVYVSGVKADPESLLSVLGKGVGGGENP